MKKLLITILVLVSVMPVSSFASDPGGTGFKEELLNGLQRLGGESRELVTTPFTTDNSNLYITMGVAGAFALVYSYDTQIHGKLTARNDRTLQHASDVMSLAGDPYLHLGLAALVYGGAIAADSPSWKKTGEKLGEALILADAASLIIKSASGRGRPGVTSSKGDFKPFAFKNEYDSLPSLHTSSSFALASVLSGSTDNLALKTAYYGAATAVGLARIYQNKHWASDVLLGAVIGELCGRVVTNYHVGNTTTALAPQALDGGAGLALVGTW